MRLILVILATIATLNAHPLSAEVLDVFERHELTKLGERPVPVAIHAVEGKGGTVLASLKGRGHYYAFIDTVLATPAASMVIEISKNTVVRDIEIIESSLIRQIYFLLSRLEQLHLYIRTSIHDVSSINLSLAPPRSLINGRPRRTGEMTVRRAVEAFTMGLDVPVTMSAGNDGPSGGFLNPWATGAGTIIVTAADEVGERIWPQASRPAADTYKSDWLLVAAWGVDAIAARDLRYEADLPPDPKLVERVGEARALELTTVTGTSFAAPQISDALCRLRQATAVLRGLLSSSTALRFTVSPHIRAIVDRPIDRDNPLFEKRQAERRVKYVGFTVEATSEHKSALNEVFKSNGIDIKLTFRTEAALRFIKAIARPIPDTGLEAGIGFVDVDAASDFIAQMRVSDVIRLFADEGDERVDAWISDVVERNDPKVLMPKVANLIPIYCEQYDLSLTLPLAPSE